MLQEDHTKTTKTQKLVIILFIIVMSTIYFTTKSIGAAELNKNGIVKIAIITSTSGDNVVYKYFHKGYVYGGVYSYSPNYHAPRSVGELIFVLYSPEYPDRFSIAIHHNVRVPHNLRFGDTTDLVKKVKVKWWSNMELPLWKDVGIPFSEFDYPGVIPIDSTIRKRWDLYDQNSPWKQIRVEKSNP